MQIKSPAKVEWEGELLEDFDVTDIIKTLEIAHGPLLQAARYRLIYRGRTMWTPTTRETFLTESGLQHEAWMKIHLQVSLHGGAQAKQAQITRVKNAAATLLLQQGYELHQVSKLIDQLMRKTSAQYMDSVLQGSHVAKLQALRNACQENGITFPTDDRNAQQVFAATQKRKAAKVTQRKEDDLDPAQFTVPKGFFRNEDDTAAEAVATIRPHTTGYCLATAAQADTWIQGNKVVTPDELAIVVLGALQNKTSLKTQMIELPAKDSHQRDVLLAATLVQMGEKSIRTNVENKPTVPETPVEIVAWTAWKDDFSEEHWSGLVLNPLKTLRDALSQEGLDTTLVSVWGRSCRAGRTPCSPLQATSLQMHSTIHAEKLETLLSRSGYNGWYATPKAKGGRALEAWKVVWIAPAKQTVITWSTDLKYHSGIVRNDKQWGLRFRADKFEEAWKTIFPDKDTPSAIRTTHLYKVEPLPWGVTSKMLSDWGTAQGWAIKPIKQLGARAWLLGTESHKPEGILSFNAQVVIATFLPPRHQQQERQILAGPRQNQVRSTETPARQTAAPTSDPWMDAWLKKTGSASIPAGQPAQPRAVEGPVEQRFKASDERIAKLEKSLQDITKQQQEFQNNVTGQLDDAAEKANKFRQDMHQGFQSLTADLRTQVANQIKSSERTLETSLQEIKNMLSQTVPRGQKRSEELINSPSRMEP